MPMATTTTTTTKLACFSFAAYAKTLIDNLRSLNIPILPGLTDQEFTSIESNFHFSFPPDLRSILQEGLPVGPLFPNWRSSSPQQLQLLLNLPFLNLSKNITHNNFWVDSWGYRPDDSQQMLATSKRLFTKAPVLVPIYGNCYIPSSPNTAGNPVFYVDDCSVRVLNFDLARFFQEAELFKTGTGRVNNFNWRRNYHHSYNKVSINAPAWAATKARKVEFWTEVAERGRKVVARADTLGWWNGGEYLEDSSLGDCLEDVFWKLRDGGWREEDVREMMMIDGCDEKRENGCGGDGDGGRVQNGKLDVVWHVRVLSVVLLRAGWSREDVVYSLDLQDLEDSKCCLDFPPPNTSCAEQDEDHQKSSIKQLMHLQSLEV
ncbi:uncharacterized protein LOC8275941 [Ricinus communis]|uniref:uncharacterized protein LOC8275941 n=1 Tax=Ricinus communis TaxID=3988 RepID=UPI00201A42FB|nr:uncharacterized protein LOC8275941 [Ricinus communis]